jgi:hypothetical protein
MTPSWLQAPVIRHFLADQVSVVAFLPVKVFSHYWSLLRWVVYA